MIWIAGVVEYSEMEKEYWRGKIREKAKKEYQNTCPFSAIFEMNEFQMMELKIEHHRLKMMLQTIVAKIGNDTNLKQE